MVVLQETHPRRIRIDRPRSCGRACRIPDARNKVSYVRLAIDCETSGVAIRLPSQLGGVNVFRFIRDPVTQLVLIGAGCLLFWAAAIAFILNFFRF